MTQTAVTPLVVPLATRQDRALQGTSGTWYDADDAVELELSAEGTQGLALRVRVRVKASTGSVTARLYNYTTSAAAGTGSAKTSTTFVEDVFKVDLASGKNRYRLQWSPGTTGADVTVVGVLESAQ